ncbi:MAG TPA: penicillin acylase family protein [Kutzneria sp.]
MCRQVDVRAAGAALAACTGRDAADDRGAVLWREFWLRAARNADVRSVSFDLNRPVSTPNALDTSSRGVRQALADAVLRLAQLNVPCMSRSTRRSRRPSTPRPMPGCGNVEGCHDITAAADSGPLRDDGHFGAVTMSFSFAMTGHLTRDGPVARTVLTLSQSSDPSSPHQTALYGRNGWVVDRFAEAEIAVGPDRSVSVLCGRGAWFTLRRESTS